MQMQMKVGMNPAKRNAGIFVGVATAVMLALVYLVSKSLLAVVGMGALHYMLYRGMVIRRRIFVDTSMMEMMAQVLMALTAMALAGKAGGSHPIVSGITYLIMATIVARMYSSSLHPGFFMTPVCLSLAWVASRLGKPRWVMSIALFNVMQLVKWESQLHGAIYAKKVFEDKMDESIEALAGIIAEPDNESTDDAREIEVESAASNGQAL